jgi:beta-galactosidase
MTLSRSRRSFLKRASAGMGLAWGGVRIFSESAAPLTHTSNSVLPPPSEFLYGTQFYRPPNPPRSERRELLRTIAKEYHFNIIRVYPTWDYYHRGPDLFVFDEIHEVMDYCDEFGLKVLMGVVLETAPYWLEKAHPETRYVDAWGHPRRLRGNSAQPTGGWPGLCLDWAVVRDAASQFIQHLVKTVAPHRSMYAYDCWNEPHFQPAWQGRDPWAMPPECMYCYCDQTIADFHKWLQRRYGTIDSLNEAWTRQFPDWGAIDPPRTLGGTSADWIDWRRYINDRSTHYMRFRVNKLRSQDSQHVIESHCAHHPPIDSAAESGTNGCELASVVDIWGLSCFPRSPGYDVFEGAAKIEVTRSNGFGKDFWMTELQGGDARVGLVGGGFHMRSRDIRLWNWLAIAGGAKGIIYWQYMPEATGVEATRNGLVSRDGSTTGHVQEAAKNKGLIESYWGLIKDYHPDPRVALLFDYDNALLTFSMQGMENASTRSFRGYYKALWTLDLWVDFIEPFGLGKKKYSVIIAPWHVVGKKETCERLQQFVSSGGTLILETGFGLFDEHFYYNPEIPPHGLSKAFGYQERQSFVVRSQTPSADVPSSDLVYYEPAIEFSAPGRVTLKGHTFLTPLEIESAVPIAKCNGYNVACRKTLGKGEVFYIGTGLGASIAAGNPGGIEILRAIIAPIAHPVVTSDKVRPRLLEGKRQSLLVIFNDTSADQNSRIKLPSKYRRAVDIHSGKRVPVERESIQIDVPYEDAVVLELTT